MLNKRELISHLKLSRDKNTYEGIYTDVELTKKDLDLIIKCLGVKK